MSRRISISGRDERDTPGGYLGGVALNPSSLHMTTSTIMRNGGIMRQSLKRPFASTLRIQTSVTASAHGIHVQAGNNRNIGIVDSGIGNRSFIDVPRMREAVVRNTSGIGGEVVGGGRIEAFVQPPPDVPGSSGSGLARTGQAERSWKTNGVTRASDAPQDTALPAQPM